MHRAGFHFVKALGVPSWVTGNHKPVRKGAKDDDAGEDDTREDDTREDDARDDDARAGDGDIVSNIGNEGDNIDIDTSMDVDASADDVVAMAETLIVDFDPGDTIGKLLAFVNQVRMSSEDVREYLAHSCRMHNIKVIELRLWVRSRWGSLSHCLSATLAVQKVCYF
jgi:hypothetical protein